MLSIVSGLLELWETPHLQERAKRWIAYQDGRNGIAAPDYTPLSFFSFFDNTQRYVDLIEDE